MRYCLHVFVGTWVTGATAQQITMMNRGGMVARAIPGGGTYIALTEQKFDFKKPVASYGMPLPTSQQAERVSAMLRASKIQGGPIMVNSWVEELPDEN